jgi:hypothetical protein
VKTGRNLAESSGNRLCLKEGSFANDDDDSSNILIQKPATWSKAYKE